jgi:hypothetical protein
MSGTNIGQILNRGILKTHSPGIKTRTRHSAGNGIKPLWGKTKDGVAIKGFVQDIESFAGKTLLKSANVGQDTGVVDADDKDAFIAAAKTGQWEREISVRTLA